MQEITDHNMAKELAEKEASPKMLITEMQQQISSVIREQADINERVDGQEQYGRRNILEFLNFIFNGHPSKENCTLKVIRFLDKYLGIKLSVRDIEIAHRMPIPEEKKKYGKNYLPPIYCKFVHRSVVLAILRKRHLLQNAKNQFGQKYIIKQNLTLCRRRLWEKAEKELTSYQYGWIKNGNILVKKNSSTRAIKITGQRKLQELLDIQNQSSPACPRKAVNKITSPITKEVASPTHATNLIEEASSSTEIVATKQVAQVTRRRQVQLRNRPLPQADYLRPLSLSPPPPRPRSLSLSNFPPLQYNRISNRNCLLSPNSLLSMYNVCHPQHLNGGVHLK